MVGVETQTHGGGPYSLLESVFSPPFQLVLRSKQARISSCRHGSQSKNKRGIIVAIVLAARPPPPTGTSIQRSSHAALLSVSVAERFHPDLTASHVHVSATACLIHLRSPAWCL